MTEMTVLLSVATLWALAVVSPGPNFLLTARLAIARSRRAGLQAVSGIALGAVCWAAA
jgi:threonine efflux protein